jgi:hypothetical protein
VPTLDELQRVFAEALLERESGGLEDAIVSDVFPASNRLRIYHNNFFTSLTEALRHIYPVVVRLVGERFFGYAAHAYIGQYPSRSGNLHDFGEYLPEFLGEFPPAAGLPYLPDVARLEWARHQAFHAAEHPPLALERLAEVPPERYGDIKFLCHPSLRLVSSAFPIGRIWAVNQPDYPGEPAVHLDSGGGQWQVMRRNLRVDIKALSAGEFALLSSFNGETSFEVACTMALEVEPALEVTACLQAHVRAQSVVDFEL